MKSIDEICPNIEGTDIDTNVSSELVEKMSNAISAALKESTETLESIKKEESEENADE